MAELESKRATSRVAAVNKETDKVEEKTYDIWYKTGNHHRHKTESLVGTPQQLVNKLTEMGLNGKVILAIGEGGVFKPFKLSKYFLHRSKILAEEEGE